MIKLTDLTKEELIDLIEREGLIGWQPIESAPQHENVLITYQNELGKSHVIKARFVPRFTEETDSYLYESCDEYDEANDRYTLIEGWYEQIDNWDDYSEVFIHHKPTHWQPLPTPPKEDPK